MFREFYIIILLAHVIGDFYIQNESIAKKKEESIRWVIFHCLCYLLTVMIILASVISTKVIIYGLLVAGAHTLIDIIKYFYIKALQKKVRYSLLKRRNIFFIDQLLHLTFLIVIAYVFAVHGENLRFIHIVIRFFDTVGIPKAEFISWITALLIIHKPANIAIAKLLLIYKPKEDNKDKKQDNNAGRFIGTLERIIILIFISIGQYSAIGLVLTAKSIARYDRISKEKDFAEYYLLGTLISTAIVIIISFII